MSIKESNFNEKNGSTFSHLLMVWAEGADPPYGEPDRKYQFFMTPISLLKSRPNISEFIGAENWLHFHFSFLNFFGAMFQTFFDRSREW